MDFKAVVDWLESLQDSICQQIEAVSDATFVQDDWQSKLGRGSTRISAGGEVLEKGGVNFSLVSGSQLPPAATQAHPEIAGHPFQAAGVSLVLHPRNPYVPTSHMNVRIFNAATDKGNVWWFGGGFDLTPYYGFEKDCVHWHRIARQACDPFGADVYPRMKAACDHYFHINHRKEPRGIGGLFFDDLNEQGFDYCFALTRSIGEAFAQAYLPIVQERKEMAYGERERQWQCYRRGRYVEFNLVYDRGTLFGLQSGGRTESILMSLPSEVHWHYQYAPQPGSAEEQLLSEFLIDRDWI